MSPPIATALCGQHPLTAASGKAVASIYALRILFLPIRLDRLPFLVALPIPRRWCQKRTLRHSALGLLEPFGPFLV